MSSMTARPAVAAAATALLLLAACEDAARPLGPPTGPRASHEAWSDDGSLIAYVQTGTKCGMGGSSGCGDDGGWGWAWMSSVATMGVDGSNQRDVTYPVEGYTGTIADGEAQAVAPAWSPDGLRLAYQAWGQIWTVGVVPGGTTIQLTDHPAADYSPAWSPDGARIAFGSDRDGQVELYVMQAADGSNVTRVTTGIGFIGRPAWSADGAWIAFDCMVESGNIDICAIGADGTGPVRLTSDPGWDSSADWSPDGRIAFVTARFGTGSEIAVMNGDGSAVARLASAVIGSDPDWSPDGSRIVYGTDAGIAIVQADGTNPVVLTTSYTDAAPDYSHATQPTWRPVATPLPLPPPPPDQPPQAHINSITCWPLTCTFSDGSWDDHGIVSRVWTFGDGSIISEGNVLQATHTWAAAGTYDVTLTVTDGVGQSSTYTRSQTVFGPPPPNQPPVAAFTYSCARTKCAFDGRGSTDDVRVVSWAWAFGNPQGSTATGALASIDYKRAGAYAVTLTVRDGAGLSRSLTQTVTVVK